MLPGDQFLLCSDGLSGQVTDEEMGVILQLFEPTEAAQLLIDIANLRGGPDNITTIIALVSDAGIATTVANGRSQPIERGVDQRPPLSIPLIVIGVIGLLAALIMFIAKVLPLAIAAGILGAAALVTAVARSVTQAPKTESPGDRMAKARIVGTSVNLIKNLLIYWPG